MKVAEDLFKNMKKWLLNPPTPTQLNSNADIPLDDVSSKEKENG